MQGGYFKTKRVHIFVNGSADSKAFYIHPRCRLGWNAILDCFSKTLKPNFGAIRVIRTIDGRRVVEGFNDLQHEGKYVACGLEAFRPIKGGYLTTSEICAKTKTTEYYPAEVLSLDEQKKYPCLIETMRRGRTIIYVFANGKRAEPKKVVLIKSDYEAWCSILTHIGNILDIPEGVKGLYTVFGQPLCSPYEVQHGGYYVAIPFTASFKPIKYLISQKSNSYHESSPMVTKDAYVSAAKTCPTIDGTQRKRRIPKTNKVEETDVDDQEKFEHHVTIEGTAIKRREDKRKWNSSEKYKSHLKKRHTGHPGNLFLGAVQRIETPETLNQQSVTVETIFHGYSHSNKDRDIVHESEVHITNYFQKEESTQTSAIFLEATHDKDNALVLKQKKYFLVPEKELQKFGDIDKSGWYRGLSLDSFKEDENERNEEDKREIELLAGAVVGVIIKVSEKIANRSIFGKSESELSNIGAKLSLIPDTIQPQSQSNGLVRETAPQTVKEKNTPILYKDRSVRLSVPIGRIVTDKNEEPRKESSSNLIDMEIMIHSLDKEFTPLTPTHELASTPEEVIYLHNIEDSEDLPERGSVLFTHLKRDSVGFRPEDLYIRKTDEESSTTETEQDLSREISEKEEVSDEWKKLDILDDMGIMTEDEIESDEDLELLLNEEEEFVDDETESLSERYSHSDTGEESLHHEEECNENDGMKDQEAHTVISDEVLTIQDEENVEDESRIVEKKLQPDEKVPDILLYVQPNKEDMPTKISHGDNESSISNLDYVKPGSYPESLESRRVTINTWDIPVEDVLKDKFEDELEVPRLGSQPIEQDEKSHEDWTPGYKYRQKGVEEERRSLMNFLRMKIEIALNAGLPKSRDDNSVKL